jgi:dolichyl-phosphate-mannose-protein mannosyltransferase
MADNALCTISRFILLDSQLLFFTALSVYSLVVFRNYQLLAPLSPDWFLWLGLTGLSLGLVVSVKWVGLFTIAVVGVHTIDELWEMWGNLRMPVVLFYFISEDICNALGCSHYAVNIPTYCCLYHNFCFSFYYS